MLSGRFPAVISSLSYEVLIGILFVVVSAFSLIASIKRRSSNRGFRLLLWSFCGYCGARFVGQILYSAQLLSIVLSGVIFAYVLVATVIVLRWMGKRS
jgi:uncharacterized membrane protein HdeD (DUF308 family)